MNCQLKVASALIEADHAKASVVNTPRSTNTVVIQIRSNAFGATLNKVLNIKLIENSASNAAISGKSAIIATFAHAERCKRALHPNDIDCPSGSSKKWTIAT